MKFQFAGSPNGEAKISELVLNDDKMTQSSGTIDQQAPDDQHGVGDRADDLVAGGRAGPALVGAGAGAGEPLRLVGSRTFVVVWLIRPTSLVPPVSLFTRKTSPA